jgi:hypothetical protein
MQNNVFAQKKVMNLPTYDYARYHFGFILALNQMGFSLKVKDDLHTMVFDSLQSPDIFADSMRVLGISPQPTMGFTIGIVGNLRLGKYFDLRFVPSLSFGERYINYTFLRYKDGTPTVVEIKKSITSTFVDFPLHVKYKSKRLTNARAYVLGGIRYTLDLASSRAAKKEDQNNVIVKLNRDDLLFEVGVGFDFYNGWFKFGTEIKMAYGLSDLLKREGNIYTEGIESLKSKIFQLTFTFE